MSPAQNRAKQLEAWKRRQAVAKVWTPEDQLDHECNRGWLFLRLWQTGSSYSVALAEVDKRYPRR